MIVLAVFVAAYICFVIFPNRRSWVAAVAAVVLLLSQQIEPVRLITHIDWNVMGIFVGTLIAADAFIDSRVPAYWAEHIVVRAPSTGLALIFICILTGFISIYVENVATVLIVAPIALALVKKLNINPVLVLISIAMTSNLEGAATLIGDPPSMLLAGYTGMNFMDFFWYQGRPSIFWSVQLGMAVSLIFLYAVFRKHREKVEVKIETEVASWIPTAILVLLVLALAASSLVNHDFAYAAGTICMGCGIAALLWQVVANRANMFSTLQKLDWDTTFFLMGVFILVGSLEEAGWIKTIADVFSRFVGDNTLLGYVFFILCAVVCSAFVDNVPFLAAMLPVAQTLARDQGVNETLYMFALLLGASLGGNVTPIGATANIVACGMLRREGHTVTFPQFLRLSIPYTIFALTPAAIVTYLLWR
jgi:Na+/H+ antiporter NhaD/arsenite permease-like protein